MSLIPTSIDFIRKALETFILYKINSIVHYNKLPQKEGLSFSQKLKTIINNVVITFSSLRYYK